MSASDRLKTGLIAPEGFQPLSRSRLSQGLIDPSKRLDFAEVEPGPEEPVQLENPSFDPGVTTGASVVGVMSNALRPFAFRPSTWSVLAFFRAQLNEDFTGFQLPAPGRSFFEYAFDDPDDLEFDETCQAGTGSIQVPNTKSFSLEARCRVESNGMQAFKAAVTPLLAAPATWAYPFSSKNGVARAGVSINTHPSGPNNPSLAHFQTLDGVTTGSPLFMQTDEPDPLEVGETSTFNGTFRSEFDLIFVTLDGGPWQLYVTRLQ